MKFLWLLLRNLLFTTAAGAGLLWWIPFHWFERHAAVPAEWRWPQIIGAAFALLGVVVFLHCQWLILGRGQGTILPLDPPRRFMRRGLYKWVRNPLYLALILLVGGEAVFFTSWHLAVYFTCFVCLLHLLVVSYEEDSMRFRFGAIYEDYKREVPRWLPRKPRPILETAEPFKDRR